MPIAFEAELNERQLEVVTAADGPVLAIAAAGTGKTRALTYRVAYLVDVRRIDPARILLLTFTNKAACEMLDRARGLVGESVSGLWGGTFHHMANRLLRRHAAVLGYGSDFTILDADDSRSLLKSVMDQCKLTGREYPKPEVIGALISLAANRDEPVGPLAADRFEHHPLVRADDIVRVHQGYAKRKRELNAMDFDDLLVNALRLFHEDDLLRERYQHHFQHVLVDEYQDTNIIQAQWVDLLGAGHRNVLAVGDDFQSIYAWRGADFRNIMEFPKRYPDARVVKLELNYRSVPEILAVANRCIAGNPAQFQKVLTPVRESYRRPILARLRDGAEQAAFVIGQVGRLRRDGYRPEEIAVLYRAHFHAMELQLALARMGMPFVITSGVRFFEQAHIKDVAALLRLLVQPADQLAFIRLMCLLPRLGRVSAEKLWTRLGGRFPGTSPEAIAGIEPLLPAGARPRWRKIAGVLEQIEAEGLAEHPGEIIQRFYEAFYADYLPLAFDNPLQRADDITEFIGFAGSYDSIASLVNEAALLTNMDTGFGADAGAPRDGIRLSTVHQAKGLEWKAVFILWATDGMFPSVRALGEAGGEAEERRLFYVSVTRAKDELFLCVPELRRTRDGGYGFCSPSRFVAELPARLLQRYELGPH